MKLEKLDNNTIVPVNTKKCPNCGGELWQTSRDGMVQCVKCSWWGWRTGKVE